MTVRRPSPQSLPLVPISLAGLRSSWLPQRLVHAIAFTRDAWLLHSPDRKHHIQHESDGAVDFPTNRRCARTESHHHADYPSGASHGSPRFRPGPPQRQRRNQPTPHANCKLQEQGGTFTGRSKRSARRRTAQTSAARDRCRKDPLIPRPRSSCRRTRRCESTVSPGWIQVNGRSKCTPPRLLAGG